MAVCGLRFVVWVFYTFISTVNCWLYPQMDLNLMAKANIISIIETPG